MMMIYNYTVGLLALLLLIDGVKNHYHRWVVFSWKWLDLTRWIALLGSTVMGFLLVLVSWTRFFENDNTHLFLPQPFLTLMPFWMSSTECNPCLFFCRRPQRLCCCCHRRRLRNHTWVSCKKKRSDSYDFVSAMLLNVLVLFLLNHYC